jgi:hypothetical protein
VVEARQECEGGHDVGLYSKCKEVVARKQEPSISLSDSAVSAFWLVKIVLSLHFRVNLTQPASATVVACDTALDQEATLVSHVKLLTVEIRGEKHHSVQRFLHAHGTRTFPVKGCKT